MLLKVVKSLKNLGEVKKPSLPPEKVGVPSLEEKIKEEQKIKEIEMWKPPEKKKEKKKDGED